MTEECVGILGIGVRIFRKVCAKLTFLLTKECGSKRQK